jgi:hypothetical protein
VDESQKEALRGILTQLTGLRLAAQRTCTVNLTFDGQEGRGEMRNCSGEVVGNVRNDEAGFLKDKIAEHQAEK